MIKLIGLPENIFPLTPGSYPLEVDVDPFGDLMFYSPKDGWIVTKFEELEEMVKEYKCTHWTYTPEIPPMN